MKKSAIVVITAISLAVLTGVGISWATQWGPSMMNGNGMPQGMHSGITPGNMHAAMGPHSNDSGNGWQRMWEQCRQFWSGHDRTEGPETKGSPQG